MTKFYNSIKLMTIAVIVGIFGIGNANAATSEPQITPDPGSNISNSLYAITLMWNGEEITRGSQWSDTADITITGGTAESGYANYQMIDSDGNMIYDKSLPGAGIRASFSYWVTPDEPGGAYNLTLNIPEGLINIDGTPNEEMELSYTIIVINSDMIITPTPNNEKYSSLSSFSFKWEYYDADINSESDATITYSGDKKVQSITKQDNGYFLVNIGETITQNGYVSFNIPEGICVLKTKYGEIPSPAGYIMYEIQQYQVTPSDWSTVTGLFDRITVASDEIELVGNISDILLVDTSTYTGSGNDGIISRGESYQMTTTQSGKQAMEIVFEEGFEGAGMVRVIIPAGTFKFNGNLYEQEITVTVSVKQPVPDPNAFPADGWKIKQLDLVTMDWNHSAIYTTWNDALKATLVIDNDEPIDISEYVKIVNDEEDSGFGWTVTTNGRIVVDFGDNPYTRIGTYTLTIPAGWVTVENYAYDMNDTVTLTYYVTGESSLMEEASYETPFGNNGYVPAIEWLSLSWEKQPIILNEKVTATLVYNNEQTWNLSASIIDTNEDYDGPKNISAKKLASEEDNTLVLNVIDDANNSFVSKPGTYVYNIPEGLVINNDGELNPAQTIIITVAEITKITPTVTPVTAIDGSVNTEVDNLDEVSVSWNNLPIELLEGSEIRILSPDESTTELLPSIISNSLIFNLSQIATEEGIYEIIIPEGAYIITAQDGKELSQELNLVYDLKKGNSVAGINEEPASWTVYSIEGIHILTTTNKNDLDTLSPGLYIVNNKKLLIRK